MSNKLYVYLNKNISVNKLVHATTTFYSETLFSKADWLNQL